MGENAHARFVVLSEPTPFYKKDDRDSNWNTLQDIFGGPDGSLLKLDSFQQVDPLEIGLEAGDVIEIVEETRDQIFLKVKIPGLGGEYYTDRRFINENTIITEKPSLPEHKLPSKETILQNLRDAEGTPYIWGGTKAEGFPKLLELYPPQGEISDDLKRKWIGAGYDCSGLLFRATNFCAPRNTKGLAQFGNTVEIENLSIEEIMNRLEPLDILVWTGKEAGHVIIALNKDEAIESRLIFKNDGKGGIIVEPSSVKIKPMKEVLEETIKKRTPVNQITDQDKQFVIRRWYKNPEEK